MHNVAATAATSVEGIADRSETWLRPARHVKAGDLRPGDIVQQYGWSLHVRKVDVGRAVAEITVAEFGSSCTTPLTSKCHWQRDDRPLTTARDTASVGRTSAGGVFECLGGGAIGLVGSNVAGGAGGRCGESRVVKERAYGGPDPAQRCVGGESDPGAELLDAAGVEALVAAEWQ